MSDFHYVRTLGRDGGVDVCAGQAIGEELGNILKDGLPPFNVVLQIMAGLCEILDIAEEDGEVHGNISPEFVFIDDTGAVSLEGFGQTRSRAPEGKPKGPMTDLYGLGCVAYELFSGKPLPQLPTDDAGAHDDEVIDRILQVDFEGLNEEMVGDVQWFLAKLLSFDREDRPPAVECWRTFVAFADEAKGPDFVAWCSEALDGGGLRRDDDDDDTDTAAPPRAEEDEADDDLDGPLVSRGPLQRGGLSFDPGAMAGGTAFFSKDDLKAALDRQEPQKPAAGGGSATNYWSRDELKAMAEGQNAAPRPKRAKGEGERRKTMAMQKKDLQRAGASSATAPARNEQRAPEAPPPPAPPVPPPPAPPPPRPPVRQSSQPQPSDFQSAPLFEGAEPTIRMQASKVRTTRTPAPAPQVFRPPGAGGTLPDPSPPQPSEIETAVQDPAELERAYEEAERERAAAQQIGYGRSGPAHAQQPQLPVEPPVPAYQQPTYEDDDGGGSNTTIFIVGGIVLVVVIAVVACMGLGGSAGIVAMLSSGGTATTVQPAPGPTASPKPTPLPVPALPDPTEPSPDPSPTSGPQPTGPKPTGPKPTGPKPTPTPSPGPKPTGPKPTPTPSPTSGPKPSPTPTPTPTPTPRPGSVRPKPGPEPVTTPPPEPDAPADQPVTLTLKSSNRGRLTCPGVANKEFDGNTLLNIEPYQLPATCMVIIDGNREAFQVKGTGSITCNLAGGRVSCDKSFVP